MAIARQRDPELVRAGLAAWLREPVGELTLPTTGGLSSDTYMFEAESGPMVARMAPPGDGLFPRYDLEMQARIMQALGADGAVRCPA